jgi:hypothetical protein
VAVYLGRKRSANLPAEASGEERSTAMVAINGIRGVMGVALAAWAVGCGGGGGGSASGSSVDVNALRSEYTAPSGTLTRSNLSAVAMALSQDQKSAGIPTGFGAHADRAQAAGRGAAQGLSDTLHPQSGPGSFTYNCPGGGSLSEQGEGAGNGYVTATIDYQNCVFTEGSISDTANGTITFAEWQGPPLLLIYKGSLTVTVTPPGTTTTVYMNYALDNGNIAYSVQVSDGNVIVSVTGSWDATTDSGTFTATDKTGTWSCTFTNGSGTCTGTAGMI